MRAFRAVFVLFVVVGMGVAGAYPTKAAPRLLVDMHTGEVLYAQDAGLPWYPASLTKLMTAFVTFRAIETGRVSLNTPVILTPDTLRVPPSRTGLPSDTAIRLEDALYVLIVKSANDVALAIAKTVSGSVPNFVAEMNDTARQLGMSATHYLDPNGLSDGAQTNSARDLAVLSVTLLARYPQYRRIFSTYRVRLDDKTYKSYNNLLTDYPGATGMKTGFICEAGLNIVATARRGARELLAIVMGASSARERGELTAKLLDDGFAGTYKGQGVNILSLANQPVAEPVNMRSKICGADAKQFVAAQKEAFPYGLKGEPSFLEEDSVDPRIYRASTLGRLRDVPLPRRRPIWALPTPAVAANPKGTAMIDKGPAAGAPLPRARPVPVLN